MDKERIIKGGGGNDRADIFFLTYIIITPVFLSVEEIVVGPPP